MELYVDFYDKNLTSLFCEKFEVLSIHKKCLNLICRQNKRLRLVSIILSNNGIYDIAADRIIVDVNRYPGLEFTKLLSSVNNVVWYDKCLSLTSRNCIIKFCFNHAKKFQLEKYKKFIILKNSFSNFYSNLISMSNLFNTDDFSKEIILAKDKVFTAIKKNDKVLIEEYIKNFIGMGKGSTPEFDDFLSGVIFMIDVYTYLFNKRTQICSLLNILKICCKQNLYKTTFLSQVFLSHILSKKWPVKMIELINGLCTSDMQKIYYCSQLILNDGATSGKIFLYAMVKTAEVIYEKYH